MGNHLSKHRCTVAAPTTGVRNSPTNCSPAPREKPLSNKKISAVR